VAAVAAKSRDWRHARTHRETRHEVTRELALPPGLAGILQTLTDEIDALKAADRENRAELEELKSAIREASAHLTEAA
jgi:hypothetical protein